MTRASKHDADLRSHKGRGSIQIAITALALIAVACTPAGASPVPRTPTAATGTPGAPATGAAATPAAAAATGTPAAATGTPGAATAPAGEPVAVCELAYYTGDFAPFGQSLSEDVIFPIEEVINLDPPLGRPWDLFHEDLGTAGEA